MAEAGLKNLEGLCSAPEKLRLPESEDELMSVLPVPAPISVPVHFTPAPEKTNLISRNSHFNRPGVIKGFSNLRQQKLYNYGVDPRVFANILIDQAACRCQDADHKIAHDEAKLALKYILKTAPVVLAKTINRLQKSGAFEPGEMETVRSVIQDVSREVALEGGLARRQLASFAGEVRETGFKTVVLQAMKIKEDGSVVSRATQSVRTGQSVESAPSQIPSGIIPTSKVGGAPVSTVESASLGLPISMQRSGLSLQPFSQETPVPLSPSPVENPDGVNFPEVDDLRIPIVTSQIPDLKMALVEPSLMLPFIAGGSELLSSVDRLPFSLEGKARVIEVVSHVLARVETRPEFASVQKISLEISFYPQGFEVRLVADKAYYKTDRRESGWTIIKQVEQGVFEDRSHISRPTESSPIRMVKNESDQAEELVSLFVPVSPAFFINRSQKDFLPSQVLAMSREAQGSLHRTRGVSDHSNSTDGESPSDREGQGSGGNSKDREKDEDQEDQRQAFDNPDPAR